MSKYSGCRPLLAIFNVEFCADHNWVPSGIYQGVPANAVLAGNDADGSPMYVGRAHHNGDQLVAKVIPSKQAAYVAYNGQEVLKQQFDILVGEGFQWIGSGNGHVPDGAVAAGRTSSGEELFIGRAHHCGALTPGKIHKSHGCLYIPFGGSEVSVKSYEVLVAPPKAQWIRATAHNIPFNAIRGGHDSDGSEIFVGKAFHGGDIIPAKVIRSKNVAYVSYNGQEIAKHEFEVVICWLDSGYFSI